MKRSLNMGFLVAFLVGNSWLSVGFNRRPTIISTTDKPFIYVVHWYSLLLIYILFIYVIDIRQ